MDAREWITVFVAGLVNPATLQGAVIFGILLGGIAWLLTRAVGALGRAALSQGNRVPIDRTSVTFLRQLLQVIIYVVAIGVYFNLIPQLRSLGTALLAGVSIASVVIGLAAQSTLSNFIAGVSLLLYRPFKVADRIQVNAPTGVETGIVEAVTLGYTVLRTLDRRRVVVPNSIIANQVTVNLTYTDKRVLISVPFQLGNGDVEAAREILTDLAIRHPHTQSVIDCPVTSVAPYGLTLTVRLWCMDPVLSAGLEWDLLEQARTAFAATDMNLLQAGKAG